MPRRDIEYEFDANPGDYGLIGDELYAVVPGVLNRDGGFVFVYLERPAHPPWDAVLNPNGSMTVGKPFRIGDHKVYMRVELVDGRWHSLNL
jgi:hypothetical protein